MLVKWWMRGAERLNPSAMHNAGARYHLRKEYKLALTLMKGAAESGMHSSVSQNSLIDDLLSSDFPYHSLCH
jgi:Flp pilus assembly protein TadD